MAPLRLDKTAIGIFKWIGGSHSVAGMTVAAMLGLFLAPEQALAAGCLADARVVKFTDGSTRLNSYLCKLGNSEIPQVRVEFHRLNETAAGHLLLNLPYPGLEKVLGKPRLLSTKAGIEAKKLFTEFGSTQIASMLFSFSVEPPKGGKTYSKELSNSELKLRFLIDQADMDG